MTSAEQEELKLARSEAKRRWAVWGGWARWDKIYSQALGKYVTWAVVGIREDDPPRGIGSRVLARGKTFQEAFENAEILLKKRATRKPMVKKAHPKALPQASLDL